MGATRYVDLLDEELLLRLAAVSPDVRRMVEYLVSGNAVARTLGLDGISDCVLRNGELAPRAAEAIPFLLALAVSPRYPHASAVLVRLAAVLDTLGGPRPSGVPASDADAVVGAIEACLPALLRVARTSTDPEACRAAASVVSHFPSAGEALEPILFALLTGARDAQERARLLYRLARVQGARGSALHPRIERALDAPDPGVETAAAALALAEVRPSEPLRGRVVRALEALVEAGARPWSDPRAWGARYEPEAARHSLARLREP